MNIIGFTGLATAGKSTAAKALVEKLGYKRISFADPIRAMLMGLGLTQEDLTVHKNKPIDWLDGKKPRELMQSVGTEWGRDLVHPEIWIRCSARRIDYFKTQQIPGIVFDDVRFDNEAEMIRRAGGTVIRIEREGLVPMSHVSEAGVSNHLVDATIENQWAEDVFGAVVVEVVKLWSEKAAA